MAWLIKKGKKLPAGAIRTHGGVKKQKQSDGTWKRVREGSGKQRPAPAKSQARKRGTLPTVTLRAGSKLQPGMKYIEVSQLSRDRKLDSIPTWEVSRPTVVGNDRDDREFPVVQDDLRHPDPDPSTMTPSYITGEKFLRVPADTTAEQVQQLVDTWIAESKAVATQVFSKGGDPIQQLQANAATLSGLHQSWQDHIHQEAHNTLSGLSWWFSGECKPLRKGKGRIERDRWMLNPIAGGFYASGQSSLEGAAKALREAAAKPLDGPRVFRGMTLSKTAAKKLKAGATLDLGDIASFSGKEGVAWDFTQSERASKAGVPVILSTKLTRGTSIGDVAGLEEERSFQEYITSGRVTVASVSKREGRAHTGEWAQRRMIDPVAVDAVWVEVEML